MKHMSIFIFMALMIFISCDKEGSSAEASVKLEPVKGFEVIYDPISEEEFNEKFQPGWQFSSIHDVYPDGSLGKAPKPLRLPDFSIDSKYRLKVYGFFSDDDGDIYNYRYARYGYDENKNWLSFNNYYEAYYSTPGVYVFFAGGIITSLTDTSMDLVAPAWKYGGFASENAVYTLLKFKKLSEERVAQLDSLHTEQW